MTTRYFSRVESSDSFSVNTWWRWFPAYYSALNRGAEYCDERVCVCVFVCPRSYLRSYKSDLNQILVRVT